MSENAIQPAGVPAPIGNRNRRSIFNLTQDQFNRLEFIANLYVASTMNKSKLTKGDAFMAMLKGMEVGLEPMAAMNVINIIQGNPTLSPQGMLALIHASGELEDIEIYSEPLGARCTMRRKGKSPHSVDFSIQDAKAMGLDEKDNWKKQPAVMLQWRAVAACARVVFPDVIQGMYTPEEMAPNTIIDSEGNVIGEIVSGEEPPREYSTNGFLPPPVESGDGWFIAQTVERVKAGKAEIVIFKAGNLKASLFANKADELVGFDLPELETGGNPVPLTEQRVMVETVVSGIHTNVKRAYIHVNDNTPQPAQKPVTPQAQSAPNRTGQTTAGWPTGDPATINRDDASGFRATVKLQTQDSVSFTAICMSRQSLAKVEAANDFVPCYEVSTGMAKFWVVDL
jgi:hypothetical protein